MTVELIRDEYRLRSLGSRPLAQGSGTFPACLSPTHPRCSWHCTHNFLLAGQRFLQPPPAGILGAGVQRGLLGRGFHQESLDSVRTECSFERHLLMDERTNTERPRSFPLWGWLYRMYLLLCKGDTKKPRENHFLSLCALKMFICTDTLACTLVTWGRGQATPA